MSEGRVPCQECCSQGGKLRSVAGVAVVVRPGMNVEIGDAGKLSVFGRPVGFAAAPEENRRAGRSLSKCARLPLLYGALERIEVLHLHEHLVGGWNPGSPAVFCLSWGVASKI